MSRKVKFSVTVLTVLLLLSAGYILYMEEQGNFHTITEGEAYRSAQLDRDEIEYYIRRYNIKSILNLRGKNPNAPWYIEELEVSRAHNVIHYDISLSATREMSDEVVQRLIEVFRTAPRPVLIHCRAGADRSSLASAIWKVIVDKEPKSAAKRQLSILYGHIPAGGTAAMDRFFEKWTLGRKFLQHNYAIKSY